ncbi:peptidylprolyl isomerase [Allosphingosinicella sp.]|uniref:peptidylprolyl isomerase n=1 Tax=Allosphingosinicella sp. TaxID=2823234 RepID=UPI00378306D3
MLIAPLATAMASAQGGQQPPATGQLNIPSNVQFVGQTEQGVRKATAIVNGDVITGSDVDQRMAWLIAANQIQLPANEVERFRAQVLRGLIDESLEIQAATQQEIGVEDREVDQYYARFAQQARQPLPGFGAFLRSIGSSERSLRRLIRGELSWQRVQRRNIEPFVTVGDDEVQTVMARLVARRGTPEYHVAEIYMSAPPETAAQVQATMTQLVQQIRQGSPFGALARQYSEATTAATGGDLGWIQPDQLPPELAGLVPQMPVGAVSDPIANSGGFSIIALVDTRRVLTADPRDARLSLMQLSIAMPAGSTPAQTEARGQELGQAAQRMGGCGNAQATAQRLGAELISNDQVPVRELPPALQQMLLNLGVGQATQAFGSAERISVLVMCGREDPPEANNPNADAIMNQMTEQRVQRRAQRYLRDLRRDAVIDYR